MTIFNYTIFFKIIVLMFVTETAFANAAVLLSASSNQRNMITVTSPQVAPPDGYISIGKVSNNVRVDQGLFLYCTEYTNQKSWAGKTCKTWGSAQEFIRKTIKRDNVQYVGMGVNRDEIFLFYKINE